MIKFAKLILIVFLLNLALLPATAELAHAQAVADSIQVGELASKDNSEADCLAFSAKLKAFTSETFEAKYIAGMPRSVDTSDQQSPFVKDSTSGITGACKIREVGKGNETSFATSFETRLRNLTVPLSKTNYNQVIWEITQQAKEASGISKVVGWIVSSAVGFVTYGLASLATLAAGIFSLVLDYTVLNNIDGNTRIVSVGWKIVRDFMNLIFILALIYIAITTMLGSGDYRRLLVQLVLMGILINFSKFIAITLIKFSNTVTAMFAKDINLTGFGKLIYDQLTPDSLSQFFSSGGPFTDSVQSITQLFFVLLIAVTFLTIAGYFIVRFVGLYVLVIVSPAAFALNVLPQTKRYSSMWWNRFISYLVFLPVSVFFIRLTLLIMNEGGASALFETGANANSAWTYVVLMGFLWASIYMGKSAGLMGADMVDRGMNKLKSAGRWTAGAAGSMTARGTPFKAAGQKMADAGLTRTGNLVKNFGEGVGTLTAKSQAYPAALKDKFINQPNKARERQIAKENTRFKIRRGYLKGADEETIKKLGAEDMAYAIEREQFDENLLRTALREGRQDTKMAIVAAVQEGRIKPKGDDFQQGQVNQVVKEAREVAWRSLGRRLEDMPDEFMSGPIYSKRDVNWVAKNNKYKVTDGFVDRVKNSYIVVDQGRNYRRPKKGEKQKNWLEGKKS